MTTAIAKREVLPVSPEAVTVLGYRVKETDPWWRGLDFAKAEVLNRANVMVALVGWDNAPPGLHLNVPYAHPAEPVEYYEGVRYRVRPRMVPGKKWRGRMVRSVAIEPAPDKSPPWQIVVEYA